MPTDRMPSTIDFDKPFRVIIPDREQWNVEEPIFEKSSLVWYTDGSKTSSGTGIGIYGPGRDLSKSLEQFATVFQAKVHAIELCAKKGIDRGLNATKIYIVSDSQAALKALDSYVFGSRPV